MNKEYSSFPINRSLKIISRLCNSKDQQNVIRYVVSANDSAEFSMLAVIVIRWLLHNNVQWKEEEKLQAHASSSPQWGVWRNHNWVIEQGGQAWGCVTAAPCSTPPQHLALTEAGGSLNKTRCVVERKKLWVIGGKASSGVSCI